MTPKSSSTGSFSYMLAERQKSDRGSSTLLVTMFLSVLVHFLSNLTDSVLLVS